MANLVDDLEYDFKYNIYIAKALLPNLENMNERQCAVRWIQRLGASNLTVEEMRLRNDFMFYLVMNVQDGSLKAPFSDNPPNTSFLTFAHLLPSGENAPANTSKDASVRSQLYARSPDGGAFLAAQPVPRAGAFCYLAVMAKPGNDNSTLEVLGEIYQHLTLYRVDPEDMGCVPSTPNKVESLEFVKGQRPRETVAAAMARMEQRLTDEEKFMAAARLAAVLAELHSIDQEIATMEEFTSSKNPSIQEYKDTFHNLFLSLGVYNRPEQARANEDLVAAACRREARRVETAWLRARREALRAQRHRFSERVQLLQRFYKDLHRLLDGVLGYRSCGMEATLERRLGGARALRDALAGAALRARAAARHAHAASDEADDALRAWKLVPLQRWGEERTFACAEVSAALARARAAERCARRVLAARANAPPPPAPRAARAQRLAADYVFTDALTPIRHKRAAEVFTEFRDGVAELLKWIKNVLQTNLENLESAEEQVEKIRKELRGIRINSIAKRGLMELRYDPVALAKRANKDDT